MNIGNELAQIKYCKNLEEIQEFLENHNLKLDHWYFDGNTKIYERGDGNTSNDFESTLYVVAYYRAENGVFISMTFNFSI